MSDNRGSKSKTYVLNLMQCVLLMQVFVDRKGRTIDLALCLVQANSVLLLVSPSRRKALLDRLDQYIFFGDKVRRALWFTPCLHLV